MSSEEGFPGPDVTVPLRKPTKYEVMLPQIVEMAEAGSGVDLISRARCRRRGRPRRAPPPPHGPPPARVDGRRRQPRQPGKPFVPTYKQIAQEVDRHRKGGEGFDRLAREMKVSRPTVVRAYDFANRDEAAAAARQVPAATSDAGRRGRRSTRRVAEHLEG